MDENIVHYQVFRNGESGCVFKREEEAIEMIVEELQNDVFCFSEDDRSANYQIRSKMMTPEEYEELPEWDGW
jgi:hypothetical protein